MSRIRFISLLTLVVSVVIPLSAVQSQVSAGEQHPVGLKNDGTVVAVRLGWQKPYELRGSRTVLWGLE